LTFAGTMLVYTNMTPGHLLNWYAGWSLILTAFISGAIIGSFFHRDDFLGGYSSFPRRILRLGHISLAALGMLNVLFAIAVPPGPTFLSHAAGVLLVFGAISMPAVCLLSGWRKPLRHLFFIPVTSLLVAVVLILLRGAQ
jgi:hypothetical protein